MNYQIPQHEAAFLPVLTLNAAIRCAALLRASGLLRAWYVARGWVGDA